MPSQWPAVAGLHYEAAREAGVPRAKIDTLTAW
jgi:hypothetical protein